MVAVWPCLGRSPTAGRAPRTATLSYGMEHPTGVVPGQAVCHGARAGLAWPWPQSILWLALGSGPVPHRMGEPGGGPECTPSSAPGALLPRACPSRPKATLSMRGKGDAGSGQGKVSTGAKGASRQDHVGLRPVGPGSWSPHLGPHLRLRSSSAPRCPALSTPRDTAILASPPSCPQVVTRLCWGLPSTPRESGKTCPPCDA